MAFLGRFKSGDKGISGKEERDIRARSSSVVNTISSGVSSRNNVSSSSSSSRDIPVGAGFLETADLMSGQSVAEPSPVPSPVRSGFLETADLVSGQSVAESSPVPSVSRSSSSSRMVARQDPVTFEITTTKDPFVPQSGRIDAVVDSNRPSALREFARDVGSGFTSFSGLARDVRGVERIRSGAGSFGEELGAVAGTIALPLSFSQGGAVTRGAGAVRGAVQGSKLGRLVTSTRAGRTLAGVTEGTLETIGIIEGSKAVGRSQLTPEGREFAKTDAFAKALLEGRKAEEKALKETGFQIPLTDKTISPRGFLFEFVGGFTGGKLGREAFAEGVRGSLEQQGFKPDVVAEGVDASGTLRKSVNVGEVASLVNIGRFSERFGRAEVGRTLAKASERGLILEPVKKGGEKSIKQAFKKASIIAPSIGQAGFIEGFAQEMGQQRITGRDDDVERALVSGSIGALSASTIGGAIGGFQQAKPSLSRQVEFTANILDPFEKPGDIAENVREALVLASGRSLRTPVFTSTFDGVSGFGVQTGSNKGLGLTPDAVTARTDLGIAINSEALGFAPKPIGDLPSGLTPSSFSFSVTPVDSKKPKGRVTPSFPVQPIVPSESPSPINILEEIISDVPDPVTPVPPITPVPIDITPSVPVQPNVFTDVTTFADVIETTPVPITVGTGGGFFFPPFLTPSGSPGFGSAPSKRGKKKGKATISVGQSLFNLGNVGFEQKPGKIEQTGLFWRF